MTLAAGTRFGPYEITGQLGAGGMGEVYRARDTRLHRDVAIKVLPELLASDPDRLSRFEREAQTLAALNHTHIAQIHGFEESASGSALVMELVEGPTLADRIAQGPMPFDEAMAIARQIVDALAAAHDLGIVHRDLKPANIKIRHDGTVKVLDFGLAKILGERSPEGPRHDGSVMPTMTSPAMTAAGMILGTAAYMAPEQARGKAVDKRADIWAFGVVLFEMIAGRRPFADGDDVVSTVASVVKDQPAFAALPAETPPAIRRLLRRCLEKDPRQRLADIGDARLEIADALEAPRDTAPASTTAIRRGRPLAWQLLASVLTIIAATGWWWALVRDRPSTPTPTVRVDVDLGADVSADSIGPVAILSPSGTRLVLVAKAADQPARLVTRLLDDPKATMLAGTDGASGPFFSPDGQWVGFFAGGKLKKARIDGSQVLTLCEAAVGRGASWSDDGAFIVAALDNQNTLFRIPAEGGAPTPVTKFKSDERSHRWPQILPGHRAVVFTANSSAGNFAPSRIAVVSLNDGKGAPVDHTILPPESGMYPRYVPTGHLIFVNKARLFAAPFDIDRLTLRSTPIPVLEAVSNDASFGSAQIDLSESGALLYHRGGSVGQRTIQWLNGAGHLEPLLAEPGMYIYPRLSPDGDRLAYGDAESSTGTDIWVYTARSGTREKLTDGPGEKGYPIWSPDGRSLVFGSGAALYWVRADGAQPAKVLMTSAGSIAPAAFAPDGKTLAIIARAVNGAWSIGTVPIRGGSTALEAGTPAKFVDVPSGSATAAFSPDGRWLAYASSESGPVEVYVRGFPDNGTKRLVSNGGGMTPMWSLTSKELFYRTVDQRLMVASYIEKGDSFVADPPRVWSTQRLANVGMTGNVDLAPDGKRFAALISTTAAEPAETRGHFTLVLNFFDELRRATKPK